MPAITSPTWSAASSSGRACWYRRRPAGVSVTPRGERSSSRAPTFASSAASRFDSDGCETCSRTAARPSVPRSAATQNARSSLRSGVMLCGMNALRLIYTDG